MPVVSISQAAKLVKKGRQTLYNHNGKGKLSFTTTDDGKPGVDTTELIRVYGKLHMSPDMVETLGQDKTVSNIDSPRQVETPKQDNRDSALQAEIDRIRELLDIEKTERGREREQASERIEELKNQRDKWEKQANSAMLRLEYQETKEKEAIDLGEPQKAPRRLWGLLPPKRAVAS